MSSNSFENPIGPLILSELDRFKIATCYIIDTIYTCVCQTEALPNR